jgi:hypothetical protein
LRPRAVAPFLLHVIEKGDQERGIDLGEPELRWLRLQAPLAKLQERAERVAVAGDGVVERSLGWMARFHRLARDCERPSETVKGLHHVAFSFLMLRRTAPQFSSGS